MESRRSWRHGEPSSVIQRLQDSELRFPGGINARLGEYGGEFKITKYAIVGTQNGAYLNGFKYILRADEEARSFMVLAAPDHGLRGYFAWAHARSGK